MKVVQINATYGIGSTGVIVKDIGEKLRGKGYEERFIYQFGECASNLGYRAGNRIDWKWHALYTRLSGAQGYASKRETKKILRYLESEKPDVVHLHNIHSNFLNFKLLFDFLSKNGIATVITLHDCWFFTGKCCHFTAANCKRWLEGCGQCPCLKEDIKSLFFDKTSKVILDKKEAYKSIKKFVVVGCSDWICGLAKKSPVFQNKEVVRIYNGVDINIFAPADRDCLRKKFSVDKKFVILGMANKWLDKKNNKIFSLIRKSMEVEDVLYLVGCNDKQKTYLKKYSNVKAVGFIKNRKELAEIYNVADVFINLTYEDTLPTVNMEALACGTPVITYDSCGSPELVEEGKTGFIISKEKANMIIERIRSIKERSISREYCTEYAQQCFDKEKQYLEYVSLYKRILN